MCCAHSEIQITEGMGANTMTVWSIVVLVVICAAIAYVGKNYFDIKRMPE